MPRTVKSRKLDTRSSRLKLPHQEEPYWVPLAPGRFLGYHRPTSRGAGTWRARLYEPETRKLRKHALGTADDFEEADGTETFNFEQAQRAANAWFRHVREAAGEPVSRQGPYTVRFALEDYFTECERRLVKGLDRMRWTANAHITPALGDIALARLTRPRIERWLKELAESKARKRTRAGEDQAYRDTPDTEDGKRARRDSANRVLTILKAALTSAVERNRTHVLGEPWKSVKPIPRTAKARIRFLSPDEQKRLVNACPEDFRLLVQGALYSGCRFGELIRLQVRDFNGTAGTLAIADSKSGKPRHVVLTEEGSTFFRSVALHRDPESALFVHTAFDGRQWKKSQVQRAWKKSEQSRPMREACLAAGLEPITFHELRHSYASALVNAGVPMAFVAAQLGHVDTRMVEKHYGHLAPSALAESIRKLAPALNLDCPNPVSALSFSTKKARN